MKKKKDKSVSNKQKKDAPNSNSEDLSIGAWQNNLKIPKKKFPLQGNFIGEGLRVLFSESAYADFIVHSRSSLEVEICGVLVGMVYQDDDGPFVEIEAIIRGDQAVSANISVTFTQETWTKIHQTLDSHYPKKKMVGWYHTHPGFGVEFSEMDMFIQQNFFSLPTQIALVTDPLSGEVSICVSKEDGNELLSRFWVNGREMRCAVAAKTIEMQMSSQGNASPALAASLELLEHKFNQYIQRADQQQRWFQSTMTFIGLTILILLASWLGLSTYRTYFDKGNSNTKEKIELLRSVPVQVEIEGKTYVIGAQIIGFQAMPELNVQEESDQKPEEGDQEKNLQNNDD